MKIAVFGSKSYDARFLNAANEAFGHEIEFYEPNLTCRTCAIAIGHEAVCCFVNDTLDATAMNCLAKGGTKLVALRCAGYNNVDIQAAQEKGITVVHVPAYAPEVVAEHAVALMLALNRKVHRAYARVREGNLSLEGLMGFNMRSRLVGIVGTGKIGTAVARILKGFGCCMLGYDTAPNQECRELGLSYVDLDTLLSHSEIITLHCPLVEATHHLICERTLGLMKDGVMLINTGRGALIDTAAVIAHLKTGRVGYLGLDVYEEEAGLFFEDRSNYVIQDDNFARLLTFPNVIVTGHQGFFTREAIESIARTTLSNVSAFERGEPTNVVTPEK